MRGVGWGRSGVVGQELPRGFLLHWGGAKTNRPLFPLPLRAGHGRT